MSGRAITLRGPEEAWSGFFGSPEDPYKFGNASCWCFISRSLALKVIASAACLYIATADGVLVITGLANRAICFLQWIELNNSAGGSACPRMGAQRAAAPRRGATAPLVTWVEE